MNLLFATLKDLWLLLDRSAKLSSVALIAMLFVSGLFEMGGIVFLFGYISSLSGMDADNLIVGLYRGIAGTGDGRIFALVSGLLFLFVFVLKNITGLLTSFFLLRFSMKRYERIASALFFGYLSAPLEVLYGRGVSVATQMLTASIHVFRNSFSAALAAVSEIAIILTLFLGLLMFIDFHFVMAGGVLFGVGGYAFLSTTRAVSERLGERQHIAQNEMQTVMQEGLRGIIDLKLAAREAKVAGTFDRAIQNTSLVDRRIEGLRNTPRAVNEVLLAMGIVLAAVFYAGKPGGISEALPALATAGFAGLRLTAAISRLMTALQRLRQSAAQRQNLMKEIAFVAPSMLETGATRETPSVSKGDAINSKQSNGSKSVSAAVEFKKISVREFSFTYPEALLPALKGISLSIKRGEFVGLCGPSGGGKSTLALAIMGLVRPQAGSVEIDGTDIQLDLRAWHDRIGYVGQRPFLSTRSLRENVAFSLGQNEIDDNIVRAALETAQLADFVDELPDGLNAVLGEDGSRLSGGQRQRISIARALYRDPDILIFDEATAALDTVTEADITRSIEKLSGDKTVVAIAHRLSTLRECDQIFVVDKGTIAGHGSYDALERTNPSFQRLLRRSSTDRTTIGFAHKSSTKFDPQG